VRPITLNKQKEMKSNTVLNTIVENEEFDSTQEGRVGVLLKRRTKRNENRGFYQLLDKKMSDLTQRQKFTLIFDEKENLICF
jgi:hypothetical protein